MRRIERPMGPDAGADATPVGERVLLFVSDPFADRGDAGASDQPTSARARAREVRVARSAAGADFHEAIRRAFASHSAELDKDLTVHDVSGAEVRSARDAEAAMARTRNAPLLLRVGGRLVRQVSDRIQFIPDAKALTQAGAYSYAVTEGRMELTYQLAELIDNSLRAIRVRREEHPGADASDEGTVVVGIHRRKEGSGCAICIEDDGVGMDQTDVTNWATLHYSMEDRGLLEKVNPNGPHPEKYLSGNTSYYGVGGKHASFGIARDVKLITKKAGQPMVCEVELIQDTLEEQTKQGVRAEDKYTAGTKWRDLCDKSSQGEVELSYGALARMVALEGPGRKRRADGVRSAVARRVRSNYQTEDIEDADSAEAEGGEAAAAATGPAAEGKGGDGPADDLTAAAASLEQQNAVCFTRLVLTRIKDHVPPELGDPKSDASMQLTRDLAHVYHYYLHGPDGNKCEAAGGASATEAATQVTLGTQASRPRQSALQPTVIPELLLRWYGRDGEIVHEDDLRDIKSNHPNGVKRVEDPETQYLRAAKSTFKFTIQPLNRTPAIIELRYYPFDQHRETMPSSDLHICADPSDDEGADDDNVALADRALSGTGVGAGSSGSHANGGGVVGMPKANGRRASRMIDTWWVGRHVPEHHLSALSWMSEALNASDKVSPFVADRIHGSMWVGADYKPFANKLKLNEDLPALLTSAGASIRPRDAKSAFLKWAEECHRELDKVVMYTDKLPAEAQDVAGMTRFGACSVQSEGGGASTRAEGLLRVGDCVKIPKARGRSEVVGKVKSFLVNGNHDHPKCKDGSHHVNGEVEFLPPKSREGVPSPNPVRKKLKDIERATEKEYRAYAKKLVQALPQGLSVTFDPTSGRAHPCPPLSLSQSKVPEHSCGYQLPEIFVQVMAEGNKPTAKFVGTDEKCIVVMRFGELDEVKGEFVNNEFSTVENAAPFKGKNAKHVPPMAYTFNPPPPITEAGAYRLEFILKDYEEHFVKGRFDFKVAPSRATGFVVRAASGDSVGTCIPDRALERRKFLPLDADSLGAVVIGTPIPSFDVCFVDDHGNSVKDATLGYEMLEEDLISIEEVTTPKDSDVPGLRIKYAGAWHDGGVYRVSDCTLSYDTDPTGTPASKLPPSGTRYTLKISARQIIKDATSDVPFMAFPGLPSRVVCDQPALTCDSGTALEDVLVTLKDVKNAHVSMAALAELGLAYSIQAVVEGEVVGTASLNDDGTAHVKGAVIDGAQRDTVMEFRISVAKAVGRKNTKELKAVIAEAKKSIEDGKKSIEGAPLSQVPVKVGASRAPARLALILAGEELPGTELQEGAGWEEIHTSISDVPVNMPITNLSLRVYDMAGREVKDFNDKSQPWSADELQMSWKEGTTVAYKACASDGSLKLHDIGTDMLGRETGRKMLWAKLKGGRGRPTLKVNIEVRKKPGLAAQMALTLRAGRLSDGVVATQRSGGRSNRSLPSSDTTRCGEPFVVEVAIEDKDGNPCTRLPVLEERMMCDNESKRLLRIVKTPNTASNPVDFKKSDGRWISKNGGDIFEIEFTLKHTVGPFTVKVQKVVIDADDEHGKKKKKKKAKHVIEGDEWTETLMAGRPTGLKVSIEGVARGDSTLKTIIGGPLKPLVIKAVDARGSVADTANFEVAIEPRAEPIGDPQGRTAATITVAKKSKGRMRGNLKDGMLRISGLVLAAATAPGAYGLNVVVRRGGGDVTANWEPAQVTLEAAEPNTVDALGVLLLPPGQTPGPNTAAISQPAQAESANASFAAGDNLTAWVECKCRGVSPPEVELDPSAAGASSGGGGGPRQTFPSTLDTIEMTQTLREAPVSAMDIVNGAWRKPKLALRLKCTHYEPPDGDGTRPPPKKRARRGQKLPDPLDLLPCAKPLQADGRWFFKFELPPALVLRHPGRWTATAEYIEARADLLDALPKDQLKRTSTAQILEVVPGKPAKLVDHGDLARQRGLLCVSDGAAAPEPRVIAKDVAVRVLDANGNACNSGGVAIQAWLERPAESGPQAPSHLLALETDEDRAGVKVLEEADGAVRLVVASDDSGVASFGAMRVAPGAAGGADCEATLVFALLEEQGARHERKVEITSATALVLEGVVGEKRARAEAEAQVVAEKRARKEEEVLLTQRRDDCRRAEEELRRAEDELREAKRGVRSARKQAVDSRVPNHIVKRLTDLEAARAELRVHKEKLEAEQAATAALGGTEPPRMCIRKPQWAPGPNGAADEPRPFAQGRLDPRGDPSRTGIARGRFIADLRDQRDKAWAQGLKPDGAEAMLHGVGFELLVARNNDPAVKKLVELLFKTQLQYLIVHTNEQKEAIKHMWDEKWKDRAPKDQCPSILSMDTQPSRPPVSGEQLQGCEVAADYPWPWPHYKADDLSTDEKRKAPPGCRGYLFNLVDPSSQFPRGSQPNGKDMRVAIKAMVGPTLVFKDSKSMNSYRKFCVSKRVGCPNLVCTGSFERLDSSGITHFMAREPEKVALLGTLDLRADGAAGGDIVSAAGAGEGPSSSGPRAGRARGTPLVQIVESLRWVVDKYELLEDAQQAHEDAEQALAEAQRTAGDSGAGSGAGAGASKRSRRQQ